MTAEGWREDLGTADGSEIVATRGESHEERLHETRVCEV